MEYPTHRIMAFDPGKTTGYALFVDQKPITVGELTISELWDWLKDAHADVFVIEDYKVRPQGVAGFAHNWNAGEPLQVIGALKYHAHVEHIPVVLQQPSIKPLGYSLMGGKYEKGSKKNGIHIMDALCHGHYFLEHVNGPKKSVRGS